MQVQLRVSIETGGENDIELSKTIDVASIETRRDERSMPPQLDYNAETILHTMATAAAQIWRSN